MELIWLVWLMVGAAPAQPPLPPEDQPAILGSVVRLSRTDGLVLDNGLSAPLAEGVRLQGAEQLEAVEPGALVEVRQDADGLVYTIAVLPRIIQRVPLVEGASAHASMSRFWWTYGGQDYPDSIYAAEAEIPLGVAAVALEGAVAYIPTPGEDAAEFAVLDQTGAVLWSHRVSAGQVQSLRCGLSGASITLRCRRADGGVPDHTQCVWASPTLILRELGFLRLRPSVAEDLVSRLDAQLVGVDAGTVGLAQPRVIGASPQTARDLRDDLLVALGRKHPVGAVLSSEAGPVLTEAQKQAAQAAGVTSVALSEVRYSPQGSTARLSLVHVASGELLAASEVTVEP